MGFWTCKCPHFVADAIFFYYEISQFINLQWFFETQYNIDSGSCFVILQRS